jgi:NAD(P)H-hydrate epimerase
MLRLARLIGRDEVPSDDAGRLAIAVEASRVFQQIVLLKGNRTVITDGTRAYINTTGDSSLSKAGTGDVLSGMLGTLLAQMEDPFDAACLAAHLHGLAGEIAGQASDPRSVLARDVIDAIPQAIAQASRAGMP